MNSPVASEPDVSAIVDEAPPSIEARGSSSKERLGLAERVYTTPR